MRAFATWFTMTVLAAMEGVHAWGHTGHSLIAEGVQSLLSPCVLQDIDAVTGPGSLVNASLWPDLIKHKAGWRWTARLHYMNPADDPPLLCTLDHRTKGPDILSSLAKYHQALQVNKGDAFALGMLVHLMQDLAQPLHVSGKARGGNGQDIVYRGRNRSIHEMWDTVMVELLAKQKGRDQLVHELASDCNDGPGVFAPDAWARESSALVCQNAWQNLDDATAYVNNNTRAVLVQMKRATCRIAYTLEALFDKPECHPAPLLLQIPRYKRALRALRRRVKPGRGDQLN